MNDQDAIADFTGDLDKFWANDVKPRITGMLFPDAQVVVKAHMSRWLDKSHKLRDATPPSPDGFGGWHKNPEWLVVCDDTNNPPVDVAANRISVTVMVKMFRQVVRRELDS